MKIIRGAEIEYIPASHEDPKNPGVLKKILFQREDLVSGTIQMINWAKLPPTRSFQTHYHEDMDEVFIILTGTAELAVSGSPTLLNAGDAALITAHEVHTMTNKDTVDVEYIVLGISRDQGGRTVNVPK